MSSCNLTTLINGTDCIGDTRNTINQNFFNLDSAVCSLSTGPIVGGITSSTQTTYNPIGRMISCDVRPGGITDIELKTDSVLTTRIKNFNVTTKKLAFDSGSFCHRNKIINGNFNIWQRGTVFVNANGFTADRFLVTRSGATISAPISLLSLGTSNITVSRVNITPANELFLYSLKIQRNAGDLAGNDIYLKYVCETQDILDCVDKTVTLSFYINTGTTFTSTNLRPYVYTSSGINQGIGSMHANSWSGQTTIAGAIIPSIPGTWQKITETYTIPPNTRQIGFGIGFTPQAGAASADESITVTGIQLEVGDTATPFEHRNYATEIAKCQRYYEKSYNLDTAPGTTASSGKNVASEPTTPTNKIHNAQTFFKSSKRTSPVVLIINPNTGTVNEVYNETTSIGTGVNSTIAGENNISIINLTTTSTGTNTYEWHFIADAEMY
jgi:hypothetical protein